MKRILSVFLVLAIIISVSVFETTVLAETSFDLDLSELSEITENKTETAETYSYSWTIEEIDGETVRTLKLTLDGANIQTLTLPCRTYGELHIVINTESHSTVGEICESHVFNYSYQWNTITFTGEAPLEVEYMNVQGGGNDHIITVDEGVSVKIAKTGLSFGASGSSNSTLNVNGTLSVGGNISCGHTKIASTGYLHCKRVTLSGSGANDSDGAINAFVIEYGGKLEALGDKENVDDETGEQYGALVVLTHGEEADAGDIIVLPEGYLSVAYLIEKLDGYVTIDNNGDRPAETTSFEYGVIYATTVIKLGFNVDKYTVYFDENGGEAIVPVEVTYGEKYGRLPSSSVTGLSGGDKMWYLIDENGELTDTNIRSTTVVSESRDHRLFAVRNVLAPALSLKLTAPGCISDGYQYYNPENSTRILTVTVNNKNEDLLSYTYQWYKDGEIIERETEDILTLDGNVSDSGTYKVVVTATLKDGADIVTTQNTASAEKEQQVKILYAANTILYDANGGENGPSSQYSGGTEITITGDEPTRNGYTFEGWNTEIDGSGVSYSKGETFTFENDNGNGGCVVTLYAQWDRIQSTGGGTVRVTLYPVKFETNGGSKIKDTKVVKNSKLTRPDDPEKDGYSFDGWYTEEALENLYDFDTKVTEAFTLYAKWRNSDESDVSDILNTEEHFAYVKGYEDNTVKPEKNITRAETTEIFYRLLNENTRSNYFTQENSFSDVRNSSWYNTSVSTMAALGIIKGRNAEIFAPDDFITRGEFAAICARFDDSEFKINGTFTDIDDYWAKHEILEAASHGWIRGYEDGTFRPDRYITRAEAMTMINRVLNRVPETASDLHEDMTVWPDNSDTGAWYYLPVQEATNSHNYVKKNSIYEKWTSINEAPDWTKYQ